MSTQPFPPPPKDRPLFDPNRKLERITEVYILLEDPICDTHSHRYPTGEFVLTEEAAKAWIKEGKGLWFGKFDASREYKKVMLKK
jgi:hypothetical protein